MSNKRIIGSNGIRKSISQKLSGPLLASINNGSSGMNSGSSGSWPPGSMSGLYGQMVGGGNGNIGVVWGNSSISICHQLSISRPLSIINRSSYKEVLSMSVVGINNGSSLSKSLKMILGG